MPATRPLSDQDLETVGRLPFFSAMPADVVRQLIGSDGRGWATCYDADTLLFSQGDVAAHMFVVFEGQVRLFHLTADGDERIVHFVDGGETFAEAAIFGSGHYPVNAEVVAGTRLLAIRAEAVLSRLRDDFDLALRMLAGMAERQRFMAAEIRQMKADSPAQRLATYLLGLFDRGVWDGQGRLPISKAQIASRIGIEPESLSRALQRLKDVGLDPAAGDRLTLRDADALRAFAAGKG